MSYERGKWVLRSSDKYVWSYDFNHKGQRYSGATNSKNKRIAEQFARDERDRVVNDWHRRNPHGTKKRSKPADIAFGRAVASYMDNVGQFDSNADENRKHFLRLCEADWIGADTLCSEIDTALVLKVVTKRRQEYLLSRRKKNKDGGLSGGNQQVWTNAGGRRVKRDYIAGVDRADEIIRLSPAFVNRSTCDLIKRVLNHVVGVMGIALVPAVSWRRVRLVEPQPDIVEVRFDEEARIEPFLVEGYGAAFEFTMLAGLRLENFTGLQWSQVDLQNREIKLWQKGNGGVRKLHVIYIDEVMEGVLRSQLGRDPNHVFVFRAEKTWRNPKNHQQYESGKLYPVTYWGFSSWWKSVRKATGLLHLTPHAFRRTAASRLVRDTGSLVAAQKLLGHSDIRTTAKHYARFMGDDVLEAQRKSRAITAAKRASLRNDVNDSQNSHNADSDAA